uniref:Uncharacterized protein n=1 Tax=Arundo donax TaxID=35708 RepID=A0A0A9G754_ARUDO
MCTSNSEERGSRSCIKHQDSLYSEGKHNCTILRSSLLFSFLWWITLFESIQDSFICGEHIYERK